MATDPCYPESVNKFSQSLSERINELSKATDSLDKLSQSLGVFYAKEPSVSANQLQYLLDEMLPTLKILFNDLEIYSFMNRHFYEQYLEQVMVYSAQLIEIKARIFNLYFKFYHSPLRYHSSFSKRFSMDELRKLNLKLSPKFAFELREAMFSDEGRTIIFNGFQSNKAKHTQGKCEPAVVEFETSELEFIEHEFNGMATPESLKEYALLVQFAAVNTGVINRGFLERINKESISKKDILQCSEGSLYYSDERNKQKLIKNFPLLQEEEKNIIYYDRFYFNIPRIVEDITSFHAPKEELVYKTIKEIIKDPKNKKLFQAKFSEYPGDTESVDFWIESLSQAIYQKLAEKINSEIKFAVFTANYNGDSLSVESIANNIQNQIHYTYVDLMRFLLEIEFSNVDTLQDLNKWQYINLVLEKVKKEKELWTTGIREVVIERLKQNYDPNVDKSDYYRKKKIHEILTAIVTKVDAIYLKEILENKLDEEKINEESEQSLHEFEVLKFPEYKGQANLSPSNMELLGEFFSYKLEKIKTNPLLSKRYIRLFHGLKFNGPLKALVMKFFVELNQRFTERISKEVQMDPNIDLTLGQLRERFVINKTIVQKILWQEATLLAQEMMAQYSEKISASRPEYLTYKELNSYLEYDKLSQRCLLSRGCRGYNSYAKDIVNKMENVTLQENLDESQVTRYVQAIDNGEQIPVDLSEIKSPQGMPTYGNDKINYIEGRPFIPMYKKLDEALYDFFSFVNIVPSLRYPNKLLPESPGFLRDIYEYQFMLDKFLSDLLVREPILNIPFDKKETAIKKVNVYDPQYKNRSVYYEKEIETEKKALYALLDAYDIKTNVFNLDKAREIIEKIITVATQKSGETLEKWCSASYANYKIDNNFKELFRNLTGVRKTLQAQIQGKILSGDERIIGDGQQILERISKFDSMLEQETQTNWQKAQREIVEPVSLVVGAIVGLSLIGSIFLFAGGALSTASTLFAFAGKNIFLLIFAGSFGLRMVTHFYTTPTQLQKQKSIGQLYLKGHSAVDWDKYEKEVKENFHERTNKWLIPEAVLNISFLLPIYHSAKSFLGLKIPKILKKWGVPIINEGNLYNKPRKINLKAVFKSKTPKSFFSNTQSYISYHLRLLKKVNARRYQPYTGENITLFFKKYLELLGGKYLKDSYAPKAVKWLEEKIAKIKGQLEYAEYHYLPNPVAEEGVLNVVDESQRFYKLRLDKSMKLIEFIQNPKLSKWYFERFTEKRFIPKELIRRVRAGDKAAIKEYMKEYGELIEKFEILRGRQRFELMRSLESVLKKIKELQLAAKTSIIDDTEGAIAAEGIFEQLFKMSGDSSIEMREILALRQSGFFKIFPKEIKEVFHNSYKDYFELQSVRYLDFMGKSKAAWAAEESGDTFFLNDSFFDPREFGKRRYFDSKSATIFGEETGESIKNVRTFKGISFKKLTDASVPLVVASSFIYKHWQKYKENKDESQYEEAIENVLKELQQLENSKIWQSDLDQEELKEIADRGVLEELKAFYAIIQYELDLELANDVVDGASIDTLGQALEKIEELEKK